MRIEIQGDTSIINVSQQFIESDTVNADAQFQGLITNENIKSFIFNFIKTELIDSAGIGFLVSLAKDCRDKDVQMVLKNLNNDIFQLFEDTGLNRVFTIERNGGVKKADLDIFESFVDVRLNIRKENFGDVAVFKMSGVLNHPLGSSYFKQQFLLSLSKFNKILLDLEELTFFDSLSISAILNMNNLVNSTGGSMKICNPNYIVKDLLTTLSIDLIVPVFGSREDAFSDWGKNVY